MFRFPWGDFHSLNLGWFLQKFNELLQDWERAKAGIEGALDAEIQKAEDALTDVFAARDAAAASASAANSSALNASQSSLASMDARDQSRAARDAAQQAARNAAASETAAGSSATAAAGSATQAGQSATNAANSATEADRSAGEAAESATAAGNSATAAAGSATAAAGSAGAAAQSAEDAEDAAASVEASAQQITTNTRDIANLNESLNNNAIPIIVSANGAVAVFSDGGDDKNVKSIVAEIAPLITGTGNASPDNIRSIIGWNGIKLMRAGINLIDDSLPQYSNAVLLNAGTWYAEAFRTTESSEHNSRLSYSIDGVTWIVITNGTGDNEYISWSGNSFGYVYGDALMTITVKRPTWFRFDLQTMNGTRRLSISKNRLSQFVEFVDYTSIDIEFPSENGDIFGGNLDVTTGLLTVNKKKIVIDGSRTWNQGSYGLGRRYFTSQSITDAKNNQKTLTSIFYDSTRSRLQIDTATSEKQLDLFLVTGYEYFPTLASWISYIQENPVDVVYELETPVTYQLTPREMKTLLGNNSIWVNSGNISAEYVADTKLYIDNKITELQASMLENIGG